MPSGAYSHSVDLNSKAFFHQVSVCELCEIGNLAKAQLLAYLVASSIIPQESCCTARNTAAQLPGQTGRRAIQSGIRLIPDVCIQRSTPAMARLIPKMLGYDKASDQVVVRRHDDP